MKILLTGPECSGKTTLSRAIHRLTKATIVNEYAREYLEAKTNITINDLSIIANKQMHLDFSSEGDIIVCDTGPFVLWMWADEVYEHIPDCIDSYIANSAYDYIFLCTPDIPWEPDGQRVNPLDRDRLFLRYKKLLEMHKMNYDILAGDEGSRINSILDRIKKGG